MGGGLTFASSANPNNYQDEFVNDLQNVQAVVISASPAHHRHREQLISAANFCQKYICYPLASYANTGGNNKPASGRSVIIGPDLDGNNANGAYYQLGQMAATVLAAGNPAQLVVNVQQGQPTLYDISLAPQRIAGRSYRRKPGHEAGGYSAGLMGHGKITKPITSQRGRGCKGE